MNHPLRRSLILVVRRKKQMTQFLILQTPTPYKEFPEINFCRVEEIHSGVTNEFARKSGPFWKVAPNGDEMDAMADDARSQIIAGIPFVETRLGLLLSHAISGGDSFILFWGNDHTNLPRRSSETMLFSLLSEQLNSTDGSNWELYASWQSCA